MKKISEIGSLLKKIYRNYSSDLLQALANKGFIDLRPSFLEILIYVCENSAPSIKEVGHACGLKKQTMTSHLNELERRGYTLRVKSERDKREQLVHLTEYGQKFKISMLEVLSDLEGKYLETVGEVEMDRIIHTLKNFQAKVSNLSKDQQQLF
jgi:DNA-binding MarR family transcriptional regulator